MRLPKTRSLPPLKTKDTINSSGASGPATGSEVEANKKEEAKSTVAKDKSSAASIKSASTGDAVTAASENKTTNSSAQNISSKVLNDMNQDLPKDDQFLTNSKDAIQAINDIAVEDNNSSKAQEPVVVGPSTEAHERALKVTNVESDKEKVRLSDYEPQIIPELGGSIMVHKESRLPITFSPIVMPTVQEVDSLDKLKEVRTPLGHVPANYNGTLFKKLSIHPTTVHIEDPNKLNVPTYLPKDEDKKNPFVISNDISEWKADAKRLLNWASKEEKHLNLKDERVPKTVYDTVQKDQQLHLFGGNNYQ